MVPNRRDFLKASLAAVCGARMLLADEGEPAAMLTRQIPATGQALPVIGMGTWRTFDPRQINPQSLDPLREVLQIFFDGGGRVVDSSPMYGKAEQVVGQLSTELKINDELFIATKVWTEGEQAGVTQMEQSLAKLRRQRVDLMQVHNLLDWQTHLKTLRRWRDEGRVRYIGVTHYQVAAFDELERIIRRERLDFIQLPYSLAVREAEQRLLPAARDTGTAVLVNRPFEEGKLFAKVRGKPLPDFVEPFAATWAQVFLKFILAHDAVTCVLPATSKPDHMRDNLGAGIGALPDDEARTKLIQFLF